jgi:hypothetical protein
MRFGSEVEKLIKALSRVVTPTKAEWRASLVLREKRHVKLQIETSEEKHWLVLDATRATSEWIERCTLDGKELQRR